MNSSHVLSQVPLQFELGTASVASKTTFFRMNGVQVSCQPISKTEISRALSAFVRLLLLMYRGYMLLQIPLALERLATYLALEMAWALSLSIVCVMLQWSNSNRVTWNPIRRRVENVAEIMLLGCHLKISEECRSDGARSIKNQRLLYKQIIREGFLLRTMTPHCLTHLSRLIGSL